MVEVPVVTCVGIVDEVLTYIELFALQFGFSHCLPDPKLGNKVKSSSVRFYWLITI